MTQGFDTVFNIEAYHQSSLSRMTTKPGVAWFKNLSEGKSLLGFIINNKVKVI